MKAPSSRCSRTLILSLFAFFHLRLPLSTTPWTSHSLSPLYIFLLLPSLPLSLIQILSRTPLGRASQSLLLSMLSFYLFLSLSSPAFPLTQAVSRGICHHCVHGAPTDDAFKLGRGKEEGECLIVIQINLGLQSADYNYSPSDVNVE